MIDREIWGGERNNPSRLRYIDVIKGIAVLATIFYHCLGGGNLGVFLPNTQKMIASFHMPLFFFISGYLYKRKLARNYFFSRTASLLIPYIFVNLINWFLNVGVDLFCKVTETGNFFPVIKLEGTWFLLALLYVSLIYYVFDSVLNEWNRKLIKIESRGLLVIISFATLMMGLIYSNLTGGAVSAIIHAFVGLFFFSLGAFLQEKCVFSKIIRWKAVLLGICTLIIAYFPTMQNTLVTMAFNEYGNPILFFFCSLIGIWGVCFVGYGINSNRVLEFYGKNSLITIYTQFPVFRIIGKGLRSVCSFEPINVLFCFVLTCIAEIFIIRFVNSYFPILAGKFKYMEEQKYEKGAYDTVSLRERT